MTKTLMTLRASAVAVAFAMASSQALAFDPSEGTIDEDNGTATATGGPYTVSNPSGTAGDVVCASDADCDDYLLTLNLSQAFRDSNPGFVIQFDLSWNTSATDDLDMFIFDDQGNEIGRSATGDFGESTQVPLSDIPSTALVRVVPYAVTPGTVTSTLEMFIARSAAAGGEDPCAPTGEDTEEGATVIDDEVRQLFTQLGSNAITTQFVQFNSGKRDLQDTLIASLPFTLQGDFRSHAKSVALTGPVSAFYDLADSPMVSRIEYNRPIRLLGDTQSWATRVRVAQEFVSGGPYFDSNGNVLDGTGTTLGVIDSGLMGFHPDFEGNLLHNFKLTNISGVGPAYVDVGNADSENAAGGHGTHVHGTVSGTGASSGLGAFTGVGPNIEGTFTGAAPGAMNIHWAHGAGLFVLSAVTAYQHVLDNNDTFVPRLRAINNSYGSDPGPYSPSATSSCLIKAMVQEEGIVMAFAAGNDGGDGSATATSPTCKDPTPGVICVASYNDQGTGDRNAPLSGFSSRGLDGDPFDYPDISAPGDTITSTCVQGTGTQAICTGGESGAAELQWQPWYGTISGTSMATPHVTGIIGLMTQLDPTLTPGEIELLIQNTARKVGDGYEADPQNPAGTIKFDYGAGLIDVPNILEAMGARSRGLPPANTEFVIFDEDIDGEDASDVTALSMMDATVNGETGIMYNLTLGDATTGIGGGLVYQIERNVAGKAFTTQVGLLDTGPVITEANETNNAVATSVSLTGNVLSAFVPLVSQGGPELNEPVHNIRVLTLSAGTIVDMAPSMGTSTDNNNQLFGRAFTIQLPSGTPPPSNENTCDLPGLTMVTSPAGNTGNGAGGQDDLRKISMAEPEGLEAIVFTMQVGADLGPTPIASHRWYTYFTLPSDDLNHWVAMDTTTGAPTFTYGTRDVIDGPVGVGTFETTGTLNAASGFEGDTITLILDKSTLGITTGMSMGGIAGSIRQTTNNANGSGLTVDSAGAAGPYTVVGNGVCAKPGGVTGELVPTQSGSGGGSLGLGLMSLLFGAGLLRRRRDLAKLV